MEQTISVWSYRNIRNQLWRWSTLTGLVISVGRTECLFPFDKIVVPDIALLYPAYKNNNQTRGGLGPVCATEMFSSDWARKISSRNFFWMETAPNCYGKF